MAPDATPEQVKSAYRKLAMKHHPDKGGDQAEFQKIQEAYDAITKPKPQNNERRRGEGNPFRHAGFEWHFAGGDEFWGTHQQRRNTDFTVQAQITLEQAYYGTQMSISINERVITINIPRGAQHGQRLSVANEGGREHADLPPGHLHVIVVVRSNGTFQVNGADLYTVKEVDVLDMLTGCEIEVRALTGEKISVQVPPNSRPTTRLRIPGKGMPIQRSGDDAYGALFIVLHPTFEELTPEQIEKLREVKNA